ncbi:MAG: hypothetical protein JSW61_00405 [Candidatus Thorarchaeota archaeon]|nr:MAG: hypothetical protein JSW61_00405 [Candidatus Thorarchaeota archaeon]
MNTNLITLALAILLFSARIAPLVLGTVTVLRGVILLSGQKREFEDWTRNPAMTFLSILFFIPSIIYVGLRYAVSKSLGIDIDSVGTSTTYGEMNLFLNVEKPPRVSVIILSMFITVVLSTYLGLFLLILPGLISLEFPTSLLSWYVALGVLFNTSLRSGDISLLGAALKRRPRSGSVELLVSLALLAVLYTQLMVMPL